MSDALREGILFLVQREVKL